MREPSMFAKCVVLKTIFSMTPIAASGRNAHRNGWRFAHAETSNSQPKIGA